MNDIFYNIRNHIDIKNGYLIRELEVSDYDKGYFELLNELTDSPKPSKDIFTDVFRIMPLTMSIFVVIKNNCIIATGKILFELKLTHNITYCAHIEDIVVKNEYRGNNIGKELIDFLLTIIPVGLVYKVTLNCKENNIGFYKKCGFQKKDTEMVKYL